MTDFELFSALRRLRDEIAEEEDVRRYVIFRNDRLAEMATQRTSNKEAFAAIPGVGKGRVELLRGGQISTDEFTRRCLAIHPGWSLRVKDVIETVEEKISEHGCPEHIRSDNGPEFIACSIQEWLKEMKIKRLHSRGFKLMLLNLVPYLVLRIVL